MNLTDLSVETLRASGERLLDYTWPRLLHERAATEPHGIALRYKRFGVYRQVTFESWKNQIQHVAAGFIGAGLTLGDRVALMGDLCIEYVLADTAVLYAGGIACGVYPTSSPHEVAYLLRLVGANLFFAEDQEHLDRLLAAEEIEGRELVRTIVMADARALFQYRDARIVEFDAFVARGRSEPGLCAEASRRAKTLTPDSPAVIIFSSGTTAMPKAACQSHRALLVGFAYGYLASIPELRSKPHRVVSHLPLAHAMERTMTTILPLMADIVAHIGEPQQPLPSVLREVRPTFVMGVPRTWEKVVAHVHVEVETSGAIAQMLFRLANDIGRRRLQEVWKSGRKRASIGLELAYRLAWISVIWPALHKIGMTWVAGGVSGGAPLSAVIQEAVQAWGIPLRDFFGATEVGVIGAHEGHWPPPGAPIRPFDSCDVRRGAQGELLVRGPGLLHSYWNDPAATAALYSPEGYVDTGDLITLEPDGAFRVVDRKKEIIITSGGKNVSPALVETVMKGSPYMSEVIVFGDQRKYIVALIEIDFESVAHWARQNEISYTGFASLASHERVVALIAAEVEELNCRLARVEQIKKFRLLTHELVPEDGDTTPTRKVKRAKAYERFRELVESMYEEREELQQVT